MTGQLVPIVVDSRLRMHAGSLPHGAVEALKEACTYANAQHFKQRARILSWAASKGRRIDPKTITVKGEPPEIATWILKGDEFSIPRGATSQVRTVFEKFGLTADFEDKRTEGLGSVIRWEHNVTLWEHQEDAVTAAIQRENCLVRAPTGSGKTTAAIALACRIGVPTLVIVWSSALFDQWVDRLSKELDIAKSDVGQIRGQKRKLKPITVAMQQTLYANPDLVKDYAPFFGCVMADEVQRFAAKTFMDVIDQFPARYRIGWSADERRKDKKVFLIYDIFGEVACNIDDEVLVKKRLVHEVEIRVVPTGFKAQWYVDQADDPDGTPDFNALLDSMVNNKERNAVLLGLVRSEMALGSQVLALTHRREHAMWIAARELGRCGVMLGGPENAKEMNTSISEMRAGKLKLSAGTYQAIGQGLDIPTVNVGIACTPIASNQFFFGQVRGRICRRAEGKKNAVLYYLWDEAVYGLSPIRNLKRWSRDVKVKSGSQWVTAKEFLKNKHY